MASISNSRLVSQRHQEHPGDGKRGHHGWHTVMDRLARLSDDELARRESQIQRQLRANGIAYGVNNLQSSEVRPWPLDLTPHVIVPEDWERLSVGLQQRARLKQALLKDLYSGQQVLHDGILPPALVLAHSGFMRNAMHLPGNDSLPLYSVDVSRSPSGQWYVVDDGCQALNGIGYTLENRLVLSHVLPASFREARVKRVAAWFRALQASLVDVMDTDARCVILSYGAAHPHYFEHVYLAKYLGYTLVEITDLTVRQERAWLKTVDGLQRVHVILRFIDDRDCDPLAVDNGSGTGIAGLLRAVAAGHVKVINPMGAAVLENPALNAYLKPLAKYYLNTSIELLSAPTYWLGDDEQRDHVLGRFDDVLYRDIETLGQLIDPLELSRNEQQALREQITLLPEKFVAQERIDRSVAASVIDAERPPQQITVRSFLLNRQDEFQIMDGGLCLLDTVSGGRRPAMESLEGSKDVWVLSDQPVQPDTLLPPKDAVVEYAMIDGELPSRVADNQFWLGRHAEMAETVIRLLRSACSELLSDDSPIDSDTASPSLVAVLRATTRASGTSPGFLGRSGYRRLQRPDRELQSLLFENDRAGTLPNVLARMQRTARSVRDRLSPELIRVLNELNDKQLQLSALPRPRQFSQDPDALNTTIEHLNSLLTSLAAMAGLANENITRGDGWRFLMLGRRVERARLAIAVLSTVPLKSADSRVLETVLRLFDSVITYRSRYRSEIDKQLVLHLLLLDESNPRSVAFQFQRIDTMIRELPGMARATHQNPLMRLATTGLSRVRLADARILLEPSRTGRQSLKSYLQALEQLPGDLASCLTATYFTHTEQQYNLGTATLSTAENDVDALYGNGK